jgi:L-ascorbate metabolism protein UlaG (beta-lactamase superfamily)
MKNRIAFRWLLLSLVAGLGSWRGPAQAQQVSQFASFQLLTNHELVLRLNVPKGVGSRLDVSMDLREWSPLVAFPLSPGSLVHTDSAAALLSARFYRAVELAEPSPVSGEYLATADGDVIIHPIKHATFVMSWKGKAIYVDPVGGATPFQGLPRADLILVTHEHTDHFDSATINAVKGTNPVIVTTRTVNQSLSASLRNLTTVLTNGAATETLGVSIRAVPAYNLVSANHPKGVGNGYILTVGGKNIYVSGDTDDTTELRALQGIDVAFVCMDGQYTMNVDHAASAVRQFQPRVVYAYHYLTANINRFKQSVGTDLGIEVRLRKWE